MHTVATDAARTRTGSASPAASGRPPDDRRPPGFSPQDLDAAHAKAASEILFERLGPRVCRANPGGESGKMSNFGVKRSDHRNCLSRRGARSKPW